MRKSDEQQETNCQHVHDSPNFLRIQCGRSDGPAGGRHGNSRRGPGDAPLQHRRHGTDRSRRCSRLAAERCASILGYSLRRADGRGEPLHAATKARGVERSPRLLPAWRAGLDAAGPLGARGGGACAQSRQPAGRGLPQREPVHARARRRRTAGHGLASRRRIFRRVGKLPALRRHQPGEEGRRGGGCRQPPSERARVPAPRRYWRRQVGAIDERRHAGPGGDARMDPRQHRELRRRPGPGHDLRPVRRRRQGDDADGHAFGTGSVPSRHRAERVRAQGHARGGRQRGDGAISGQAWNCARRTRSPSGVACPADPGCHLQRTPGSGAGQRSGDRWRRHTAAPVGSRRAVLVGRCAVHGRLDRNGERLDRSTPT